MSVKAIAVASAFVLATAALADAGKVKELDLAEGRTSDVRIAAPILVAGGVAPLRIATISSSYDKKEKVIRNIGSLFTGGVNAKADEKLQLGETLSAALREEAAAMGFRVLDASDTTTPAWEIGGKLEDVFADSMQFTGYGALAIWGTLQAELQIRQPDGAAETQRLWAHTLYATPTGGFGRQDEAEQGLAHLFVVGAQEILARLNRQYFKAAPVPEMEAKLKAVTASGVEDHENDLHLVSLSGLATAASPLRELLAREKEQDARQKIVEALALLSSPEELKPLAESYSSEEEDDCRWATLKAMSYLGGDTALAFLKREGASEDHDALKHLAMSRIAP